jgi:glutamine amidotransferase
MIVVADYGRGNLFSLGAALDHIGAAYKISDDPADLERAERIVVPGVGAFADCMAGLHARGMVGPLRAAAAAGRPILGICVGCQVLFAESEEFGRHDGLAILPGAVRRLPPPRADDAAAIRIPNVGWRALRFDPADPTVGAIAPGGMVYFVHSYAPVPADPAAIVATIAVNGIDAVAAVRRGAVQGFQFHPERSGPAGLALLRRFARSPCPAI